MDRKFTVPKRIYRKIAYCTVQKIEQAEHINIIKCKNFNSPHYLGFNNKVSSGC